MDLGSIFLLLALLVLVLLFIFQPLSARRSAMVSQEEHEVSALLAERDRVLSALSELDFDHKLGKVPEEFYPLQRANLLQRGAQILQALDSHGAAQSGGQGADDPLEAAITARKAEVGSAPGDDLEAMIAARKSQRVETSANFCPNCGASVQPDDRFCVKCGAGLA